MVSMEIMVSHIPEDLYAMLLYWTAFLNFAIFPPDTKAAGAVEAAEATEAAEDTGAAGDTGIIGAMETVGAMETAGETKGLSSRTI